MLKEQILGFAMKALSQVQETKERIQNNLSSPLVQSYVRGLKDVASRIMENQLKKIATPKKTARKSKAKIEVIPPKRRKSSIKPVKEIQSTAADIILEKLKADQARLVGISDEVHGKKSLAYLLWALGHAERANIKEGISVHDVSALLFRASKIELYPINISRVVFGTPLVKQVSKDSRTKTYLLTAEGQAMFKARYL